MKGQAKAGKHFFFSCWIFESFKHPPSMFEPHYEGRFGGETRCWLPNLINNYFIFSSRYTVKKNQKVNV